MSGQTQVNLGQQAKLSKASDVLSSSNLEVRKDREVVAAD